MCLLDLKEMFLFSMKASLACEQRALAEIAYDRIKIAEGKNRFAYREYHLLGLKQM